jgi:hypothetical protein
MTAPSISPCLDSIATDLTQALHAPLDRPVQETSAAIQSAAADMAATLNALDQPPARGRWTDAVLSAAEALAVHPAGTAARADELRIAVTRSGWLGTLARLFAAPAWQSTDLRPLADQSPWLWPTYARFLFAAPALRPTTAEEHPWAAHIVTHLASLVRMLESNRGSAAVKAVAHDVAAIATRWPAVGTPAQLRERQKELGRLHTLLAPRLAAFVPEIEPVAGRPLRVGLIRDEASSGPNVFASNRLKALLDPERIELTVYTQNAAADFSLQSDAHLLVGDVAEQVGILREARLDVAIFAGDLTSEPDALTGLALHRVAGRQFATALCPHTSGLPAMDGFLGDASSDPAAHTEQLAVLPAALAFDRFVESESAEPALNRTDLGLPAEGRLFVATVHPRHTVAARRAEWREWLAQEPAARLILLPGTSGQEMVRLLAECENEFGDRVIIAGLEPLETTSLVALLRVCDVCLPGATSADRFTCDLALDLGLTVPGVSGRTDSLAFADALTAVLEQACAGESGPLIAPPVACDAASHHIEGWNLLTANRPDRAVLHLMAAVENADACPEVWHDLALALHANQQMPDAVQAMETCVRIAPDRLDSWLQLADWATDYGHTELVGEIHEVLRTLAPADPRVTSLAERLAS